jgi:hypothetical protein
MLTMRIIGYPLLLSFSLCFSGPSQATAAVPGVEPVIVIGCDGFGRLREQSAPGIPENVKGLACDCQTGNGWKSPEYYRAVREVDGLIGGIVAGCQRQVSEQALTRQPAMRSLIDTTNAH